MYEIDVRIVACVRNDNKHIFGHPFRILSETDRFRTHRIAHQAYLPNADASAMNRAHLADQRTSVTVQIERQWMGLCNLEPRYALFGRMVLLENERPILEAK